MSDVIAGEPPPKFQPGALVARVLQMPRPWLLAFDVDGTLAPIAPTPPEARVPRQVVDDLATLAAMDDVHIALLTGRDAASLEPVISLPQAYLGLEHGGLVCAPGQEPGAVARNLDAQTREALDAFEDWAKKNAKPAGADLEFKRASVGIHVRRLAEQDPGTATRVLDAARTAASTVGLHVRTGRAMIEAEAEAADKADALNALVKKLGATGVFFAGDDVTDAKAITRAGVLGVGIHVASPERPQGPEGATAVLDGPSAIAAFIKLLRNC